MGEAERRRALPGRGDHVVDEVDAEHPPVGADQHRHLERGVADAATHVEHALPVADVRDGRHAERDRPGERLEERFPAPPPARDGAPLHPVQRAFHECHGLQCGFCTPGFVMSVVGLLAQHPHPTTQEIEEGIAGNLCRCTGYASIRRAVNRSVELMDR